MDAKTKKEAEIGYEHRSQAALPLAEEYEFFILMSQVVEGMIKARENELRPFGLSSIQVGLMYVVKTAKNPLTASQIARRLLRRPASVYQLLDRMEDQGLVRCIRSTEGKREVRVTLTDKGEKAYLKQAPRRVIPRILGTLSVKEREQLRAILEKLREATYAELSPRPLFP